MSIEDADVLFETTESNSFTPAAKTLAPRARIAGRVVAVCVDMMVVTVRIVLVVVVVKSALVVTVLWYCFRLTL
jgi:hypothetical protein